MLSYIKGLIGSFLGALLFLLLWCNLSGKQDYYLLQSVLTMSVVSAFFVTTMLRAKGIAGGTVFQQLILCAVVFGLGFLFLAAIIGELIPPDGLALPAQILTQSCLVVAAIGASAGGGFLITKFVWPHRP